MKDPVNFILFLILHGYSWAQTPLFQEHALQPVFEWQSGTVEHVNDDTFLVMGAGTGKFELIELTRNSGVLTQKLIALEGEITSSFRHWNGKILIGGNSLTKPAIWEYDLVKNDLQKIELGFNGTGTIAQMISRANSHWAIAEYEDEFEVIKFEPGNLQLVSMDRLIKRHRSESAVMLINNFGELFCVLSCMSDPEKNPVIMRKYNEAGLFVWEKSFAGIKGTIDELLAHPNGDIVGKGRHISPMAATMFFAHWAPNGKLLTSTNQKGKEKMSHSEIGWVNGQTLWSFEESVAFGGRMPNINVVNYSHLAFGKTSSIPLGTSDIEVILNSTGDPQGNAVLLYRNGRAKNNPVRFRHYSFNQNPCDQSLEGKPVLVQHVPGSSLTPSNDQYEFTANVISRTLLTPADVRIQLLRNNPKAPEKTNITLIESSGDKFCYKISKFITLDQGENPIRLWINSDASIYEDTLFVYNLIKRPDLYIFSVGVVYEDLNYTDKDASDFTALFSDQEGRLFQKIHTRLLNNRELTGAAMIIEQLDDFAQLEIGDDDLIFIFFSSHGELINNEFAILGSDYDFNDSRTVVPFNQEIIQRLKKMKGKKILFLDSCKSGTLKGIPEEVSPELVSSIFRIMQSAPGIMAISSSRDQQYSYEVNDLQNGIFTAAIKELFSNAASDHDLNNDRVLTIGEIFKYLENRVPEMVEYYFKDPNRKQNPHMPLDYIDMDLPVFFIPNQ